MSRLKKQLLSSYWPATTLLIGRFVFQNFRPNVHSKKRLSTKCPSVKWVGHSENPVNFTGKSRDFQGKHSVNFTRKSQKFHVEKSRPFHGIVPWFSQEKCRDFHGKKSPLISRKKFRDFHKENSMVFKEKNLVVFTTKVPWKSQGKSRENHVIFAMIFTGLTLRISPANFYLNGLRWANSICLVWSSSWTYTRLGRLIVVRDELAQLVVCWVKLNYLGSSWIDLGQLVSSRVALNYVWHTEHIVHPCLVFMIDL